MTGDSDTRHAERLVETADHHTVTVDLLTGADEYGSGFYLHDEPAIAVLEPDEQPHAVLFNEMKGVGVGSKRNTVAPDGSGATLFVVTDRRLLVLVGQADGDRRFSVPFEAITGADYSTGVMKHRIVVRTTEEPYHLWVDASYEEADLQWVADRLTRAAEAARSGGSDAGTSGAGTTGSGSVAATGTTADGGTGTDGGGTGADAQTDTTGDASGGGSDADPLDKLERLQELKEKGVVSEAEFEEKKRDLLDQI